MPESSRQPGARMASLFQTVAFMLNSPPPNNNVPPPKSLVYMEGLELANTVIVPTYRIFYVCPPCFLVAPVSTNKTNPLDTFFISNFLRFA